MLMVTGSPENEHNKIQRIFKIKEAFIHLKYILFVFVHRFQAKISNFQIGIVKEESGRFVRSILFNSFVPVISTCKCTGVLENSLVRYIS